MKPIVLKRLDGEVEVYGDEVPVIDEAQLLRRGVHLYGVLTEDGEEIYEDIHQALVALVYASLQGYQPTLIGYNREMRPVYTLSETLAPNEPPLGSLPQMNHFETP
jgi:hypothetical protein